MSVAPSFVNFTFLSEPYTKGDKMYVDVQNPKTSTKRTVRWYPEPVKVDYKHILGFDKGYITLLKGDEKWLSQSNARYHRKWGWYIVSEEEVPELPIGISMSRLTWENAQLILKEEK